jgi:potassium efflux system protein
MLWLGLALLSPMAPCAPETPGANGTPTQEQIETERKAAESDTTLSESDKQRALELYDQAAKWLQQAAETKTQLQQLVTLVRDAPTRIESIRSGEVNPGGEMPDIDSIVVDGTLERIERALTQEQLALDQARDSRKKYADEVAVLLVGSKGLSEEITEKIKLLDQVVADLQAPEADQPATLARARNQGLKARKVLRETELELLKQRIGSHDILTNLAQTERDFAAAEIAARQSRIEVLSNATQRLRESEARQARQQAEELKIRTEALPLPLQVIAQENALYREELEELVGREQSVANDLQTARLGLDEIKRDFERTRQRVEVVGASEAIGKMLSHRREALPSVQSYRRTSAQREAEIGRATDRQIDIDELLRERGDIQETVTKVLENLPQADRPEFETDTADLTKTRRDALNELQKVYGRYIGQITSLELAERQLVEVAGAYIEYIDDQLIWIPGPGIAALVDPVGFGKALMWLLAPAHGVEVVRDLKSLVRQSMAPLTLMLLAFVLLLRKRKWAAERLTAIARDTHKIRTDSFILTLLALGWTLVSVGAWPLLLVGTGWLLSTLPTASFFTIAIGKGLIAAGMIWVSTRFVIQISMPDGLGDRHLRWPKPVREALVREFGWIYPIAVPLVFVIAATAGNAPPATVQSLGRLAYIVLMGLSAVFVYRLLRRGGPLMAALLNSNGGGALAQLHFLWFPSLVLLPIVFAITSAVGYHHTSLHLEQQAELTFWFFIGLFLLKELLLRSLYIAGRRLRFEDAVRRRDELRAQRAQGSASPEEEPHGVTLDIPELNFTELNEQNTRLVRAGFLLGAVLGIWSIWSDLLPALSFLNTTELPFHASRIVDGIAREVPVTLGDLIVGLIIVAVTVLAAKNIPGVLEIALLQRLPLDPGARYAIKSLSQYTIAGIGVFSAFSTLGLQWSSIQWLVAALSVGLGFGLQEIVANFISGIILLFERPIRVGDVVTIDTTTGTVSRIRIRATTIVNWDKQELLIPNKEFITGRVINWTLTDKMNRVVITVGVAYGADVDQAMALMLEAAAENENVLDDPVPVASFEAFGDNALTLLLRAYLGSMDNRLATITALHKAINAKFRTAGVSIAFPQRDIHLDTDKPLDIRLHRRGS